MKKILLLFGIGFMSIFGAHLWAQEINFYNVDEANNGMLFTFDHSQGSVGVRDNGGDGPYTAGDYFLSVQGTCSEDYRFSFILSEFDIANTDTLYIYDGSDTTGEIRAKINNGTGHRVGHKIFVSPTNTTGILTIRFRSRGAGGEGFLLSAECGTPCESVVPVIEEKFYRTRNGEIYDSAYLREVPVYDTVWNINDNGDTLGISSIDTSYFTGAHLCIGDGVIFKGHGEYTYYHGYYHPSDTTTYFVWDMDNEGDTIEGYNITSISYDEFQQTGCHDMVLTLTDSFGCQSLIYSSVKIRTAINPIKTIFTLADICSRDSLVVNMGYSGDNATLTLKEVESNLTVSKINEVRTFIPDGPHCDVTCYSAPVLFTEYPNRSVQSASDICSICVNMEHTYMGDISVSIVCPTQQRATLFFGSYSTGGSGSSHTGDLCAATDHGSSMDMGCPYGSTSENGCDSTRYPFGVGYDYCWSRNSDYTLVTGVPAGSISGHPNGSFYITSLNTNMVTVNPPVQFEIPSYMNPQMSQTQYSGTTKMPSNHEEKTDYYLPYTDFSELIGCPLNGVWEIQVCDEWGGDNGWVFNWSMDICGVTVGDDCKYTVGIDSLVWRPNPDSIYHDYELGYYRGAKVKMSTPTVSYISTPDTAGTFPIDVFVYDEFGCVWDTNTIITSFWTPKPNLGPDTALCGVNTMLLDAKDAHALLPTENYSYQWSPFGQGTDTIWTKFEPGTDLTYVAVVTNTRAEKVCVGRDTIHVGLRKQPLPSVIPAPFVFEGCAPFTINFENTSVNADYHWWDFGDGIVSTLPDPTHTWDEGIYDLKYYATSEDGCVDSIISPAAVSVFSAPKAAFSWSPTYPSVINPTVHLTNLTTPKTDYTKYFWEVQYNVDNPLSVETFVTENVDFNFSDYTDNDFAGNFAVRLIARTDNMPPSGNMVYCRDTAENTILVVNDFLQFPNVVTPNGDGINDRFVIQNLVNGMGYPVNTLDIYNKWGARVFHKENISSDDDFWDPQDLPAGTYFYRFSAKGYNGNIEHNGAIEVIK